MPETITRPRLDSYTPYPAGVRHVAQFRRGQFDEDAAVAALDGVAEILLPEFDSGDLHEQHEIAVRDLALFGVDGHVFDNVTSVPFEVAFERAEALFGHSNTDHLFLSSDFVKLVNDENNTSYGFSVKTGLAPYSNIHTNQNALLHYVNKNVPDEIASFYYDKSRYESEFTHMRLELGDYWSALWFVVESRLFGYNLSDPEFFLGGENGGGRARFLLHAADPEASSVPTKARPCPAAHQHIYKDERVLRFKGNPFDDARMSTGALLEMYWRK